MRDEQLILMRAGFIIGIILIFCIGFMMQGCASLRLTPKQTVLWGMNVYNAQYDMYIDQVISDEYSTEEKQLLKDNPSLLAGADLKKDLTDEQKEVLKVKREILVELYPIVQLSIDYVHSGSVPPGDLQETLVRLINKLVQEVK